MNMRLSKSPFLDGRGAAEDLLVLTNSFEPRCLFAIRSASSAGFRAKKVIFIEYESASPQHRRLKEEHRAEFRKFFGRVVNDRASDVSTVSTLKYDVFSFCEDVQPFLHDKTAELVTIDITTMTKCSLAALLSLLRRNRTGLDLRCVWTPGVYGKSTQLTRGVSQTFVVPGFGGVGIEECRVLVLFLGQESSRAHALWRATDPDFVYLIASESEYSRIRAREVLESVSYLEAFCESKTYIIDGVDPAASLGVLREIEEDLEAKDYWKDVAVGCLGTKVEFLGVWLFLEERRHGGRNWHYLYAVPGSFSGGKYSDGYIQELVEVGISP